MGGDKNKDYIRGGNRGGADQFKWDDVRLMPYKDREWYLGITDKLGVLDKGGKWKRNDWWVKDNEAADSDAYELMLEKKLIKAQEEAIMRKNLGLPPKPGDKEILDAKNQGTKLKNYEIKELIRKNDFEGEEQEDIIRDADKMAGLGFSKYGGNQYNGEADASITKLEGEGLDEHRKKKEKKDKKKK